MDNIDEFVAGDFSQGGWVGWFDLVITNNPYRNFLVASSELDARIAAARAREVKLLEFGDGFLSFEQCITDQFGKQRCSIVTPGKVIQEQLDHTLGTNLRQLELADEINEIIGALITQLVNKVFTGGLLNF